MTENEKLIDRDPVPNFEQAMRGFTSFWPTYANSQKEPSIVSTAVFLADQVTASPDFDPERLNWPQLPEDGVRFIKSRIRESGGKE